MLVAGGTGAGTAHAAYRAANDYSFRGLRGLAMFLDTFQADIQNGMAVRTYDSLKTQMRAIRAPK